MYFYYLSFFHTLFLESLFHFDLTNLLYNYFHFMIQTVLDVMTKMLVLINIKICQINLLKNIYCLLHPRHQGHIVNNTDNIPIFKKHAYLWTETYNEQIYNIIKILLYMLNDKVTNKKCFQLNVVNQTFMLSINDIKDLF